MNKRCLYCEVFDLIEQNKKSENPKPLPDFDYFRDYYVEVTGIVDEDDFVDVLMAIKYYLLGRDVFVKKYPQCPELFDSYMQILYYKGNFLAQVPQLRRKVFASIKHGGRPYSEWTEEERKDYEKELHG